MRKSDHIRVLRVILDINLHQYNEHNSYSVLSLQISKILFAQTF